MHHRVAAGGGRLGGGGGGNRVGDWRDLIAKVLDEQKDADGAGDHQGVPHPEPPGRRSAATRARLEGRCIAVHGTPKPKDAAALILRSEGLGGQWLSCPKGARASRSGWATGADFAEANGEISCGDAGRRRNLLASY